MKNLLSEREILKDILENGFSGGKASKYELIVLAKHFKWDLDFDSQKIKKELVEFCKIHDKRFNPIISRELLKDVVRIGEGYHFREPIPVQITTKELEKIRTVKNYDYQKILFVILVYAKILKYSFSDASEKQSRKSPIGYFISTSIFHKIKKEIKLRISNKEFLSALHELYKLGFIEPTLTGRIKVLYSSDLGFPSIQIDEFTNIVGYYTNYTGGELLYCKECGGEFIKDKNKKDLCPSCYDDRRREQIRKNVARHRRNNWKCNLAK